MFQLSKATRLSKLLFRKNLLAGLDLSMQQSEVIQVEFVSQFYQTRYSGRPKSVTFFTDVQKCNTFRSGTVHVSYSVGFSGCESPANIVFFKFNNPHKARLYFFHISILPLLNYLIYIWHRNTITYTLGISRHKSKINGIHVTMVRHLNDHY